MNVEEGEGTFEELSKSSKNPSSGGGVRKKHSVRFGLRVWLCCLGKSMVDSRG